MDLQEIENLFKSNFADCEVELTAEGNKIAVELVSTDFDGLSRVKRQQKVYVLLDDRIKSGEIHAVSMSTMTPDEKQARQ